MDELTTKLVAAINRALDALGCEGEYAHLANRSSGDQIDAAYSELEEALPRELRKIGEEGDPDPEDETIPGDLEEGTEDEEGDDYQGDSYSAEIDAAWEDDQPVSCADCDWKGQYRELAPIGGCSLTPGDPSPAGRCPQCDTLAYIDKPDDSAFADLAGDILFEIEAFEKRCHEREYTDSGETWDLLNEWRRRIKELRRKGGEE